MYVGMYVQYVYIYYIYSIEAYDYLWVYTNCVFVDHVGVVTFHMH